VSQPKRYRPALDDGSREPWMKESEFGNYVEHSDYTDIQAENELLKEACENNLGRIDALFIRLRELQAENDRLRAAAQQFDFKEMDYIDEVSRLKAENERLNERLSYLEATWPRDPHHGGKVYEMPIDEQYYANLQLENERLRKAGDALLECHKVREDLEYSIKVQSPNVAEAMLAWLAAKKGGAK